MTDVQVSNARRIGFTAMAVVAYWVMALQAYRMGYMFFVSPGGSLLEKIYVHVAAWGGYWFEVADVAVYTSFGILPSALFCLSRHNSIFTLRDRWFLLVTVLFCVSMYLCFDLGMGDVEAAARVSAHQNDTDWEWMLAFEKSVVQQNHVVSWLYLLLPLVLTTAFVIFGAWRRAVRAREAEAVAGANQPV